MKRIELANYLEEEDIDRIFKAYFRLFGKGAPQPSRYVTQYLFRDKVYVVLDNIYGVLALYTYNLKTDRIRNLNIEKLPKKIEQLKKEIKKIKKKFQSSSFRQMT